MSNYIYNFAKCFKLIEKYTTPYSLTPNRIVYLLQFIFKNKYFFSLLLVVERLRMKMSSKEKHKMTGMDDILTVLRGKNAEKLGPEASESMLRMIS